MIEGVQFYDSCSQFGGSPLSTCQPPLHGLGLRENNESCQILRAMLTDTEDIFEVAFILSGHIAAVLYPLQSILASSVKSLRHWEQHTPFERIQIPLMLLLSQYHVARVWEMYIQGFAKDMSVQVWRANDIWRREAWRK